MFGYVQKEVVAALPKLIKLNPVVVKEVFNRLLGVHSKFCGVFLSTIYRLMYMYNIYSFLCLLCFADCLTAIFLVNLG